MINWDDYPNFTEAEFTCKCGCGRADMDPAFMGSLQRLRIVLDFALPVTSGFRCPDHNDAVSSTGRDGPHTTGKAADLAVDRERCYQLLTICGLYDFRGIGLKQHGITSGRFIHLDTLLDSETKGPRPTVWSYA